MAASVSVGGGELGWRSRSSFCRIVIGGEDVSGMPRLLTQSSDWIK